jgi:hypothetical protein
VLDDVEYARLLMQTGGGGKVRAEKVRAAFSGLANLHPAAAGAWS